MPEMLNRKKPFGEVHGTNWPWKYEQDGKKFQANGELYIEPGQEPEPQPQPEPPESIETKPPLPAKRPVGRPPNKKSEWEDPE